MIKWKCPACDTEELPSYTEEVTAYRNYGIYEQEGIYRRGIENGIPGFESVPDQTYIVCNECGEMYGYDFILHEDEEVEMEEILDTGE